MTFFLIYVLPFLVLDAILHPEEWFWTRDKEEEKVQGGVIIGTYSTLFRPGLREDFEPFFDYHVDFANDKVTAVPRKPPSNSDPKKPES